MAVALRRRRPVAAQTVSLAILGAVAVAVWGLAWSMEHATYDTSAGVLIGIALGFGSILLGRRLARSETDQFVARILLITPLLKLGMALVRFAVTFAVYDGAADAGSYHRAGVTLRASLAEGLFDVELGRPLVGAGFVQYLTGLLYTVTGPTMLGAFLVFSSIAFAGQYLLYRALCIGVPHGDRRRYVVLVMLMPSVLFWSASLGKEAWMTLGLGLSAFGAARFLSHARLGLPVAVSGLAAMAAVRPHVAAMAAAALAVAFVTRRAPRGATLLYPIGKLGGLLVLGLLLIVFVNQTTDLLGIDSFNRDAVDAARAEVATRTDQGGSAFDTTGTDFNPTGFPSALTSVLFRPFPWEATNLQSAIAASEGFVLLILFAVGWRRLITCLQMTLRSPYVVFTLTYVVLFTYGFSSFSNFGILTRQRVQVLPFALVLLALPPYRGRVRDARSVLGVDEPARAGGLTPS